ncbi:MAG: hypothetical protein ACRCX8_19440 [Sarcina sp.]
MNRYENTNKIKEPLEMIVKLYFDGYKLKDIFNEFGIDKKVIERNFRRARNENK